MNRVFLPIVSLLAALAPTMALAQQTNLDQGKSASQLFAGSCAECHKAPHGLAKGKSTDAVAGFLQEHYTTSRAQAAALAAYIVGGRDTVATPAPSKRPPEHASATTEEAKPDAKPEAKPERRREPKPKPEENATANAKPRQPADNEKPKEEASHGLLPGILTPAAKPDGSQRDKPAVASRNRRKEPVTPEAPQEPAAIAHAPAAPAVTEPAAQAETPKPEEVPAPSAKAPAEPAPGESNEPVPRDNVPD